MLRRARSGHDGPLLWMTQSSRAHGRNTPAGRCNVGGALLSARRAHLYSHRAAVATGCTGPGTGRARQTAAGISHHRRGDDCFSHSVDVPRRLCPSLVRQAPGTTNFALSAVAPFAFYRMGGDSLVIALALPYTGLYGAPLPYRDTIIFITFVIILITLVAQGLTLAPAIRTLRIAGGNEEDAEERLARHISLRAAEAALDRFEADGAGELASAAELRQITARKLHNLDGSSATASAHIRPRLAMLRAAREAIIDLRDRGEIGDAVMRHLQTEFDHEEVLLRER
jgi:hypothetical protein